MATFTDRFVRGLKPAAKLYEERDGGCPGLVLRVGQRGAKVWEVVVAQDGRRRRVRLGTYPDISLAMARRMASEAKASPAIHAGGMRVADLFEMYAAERRATRRSFDEVEQVWHKWVAPKLAKVRIEDITLRHGADLIAHVTRESSPNRARKVIRYLSPMLTYAAGRGLLPGNPWAGLHLPEGVERRDRVLSLAEWRAVWSWAEGQPYPWGPFVQALMLSAQRLGEVAGMRWAEIDGDLWTIPAARHKSKKRHEVPLPDRLAALIDALPRHDEHVFSTMRGRAIMPGTKLRNAIQSATETTDWRFHDLRRTGATMMAEGGIPRFIIERALGHADASVTGIYDRHTYREEKRGALAVLAGTVVQ